MADATIVSICPFEINEKKPGLNKGYFRIAAAKEGDFEILNITDSFWDQRLPATNQYVRVPVMVNTIADSIINDFCKFHVSASDDAHPGLFWLPGKLTKTEISTKHKDRLESIRIIQRNWFVALVKEADDSWAKYHNQKMIDDNQRYACSALRLDKDWNVNYDPMREFIQCKVCFSDINPHTVKCPNCGAILNKEKAKEFGLV